MNIMPLGDSSIAIFIDSADLDGVGLESSELDLDVASPLVTTAFLEAGISLDGNMEIEAYSNAEGILVFARVIPSCPIFCTFDRLENLLSAVSQVTYAPPNSKLLCLGDTYYLTLSGKARELAPLFREFGEIESLPPDFVLHLEEHGNCIIGNNAIGKLLKYFT